MSKEAEGVVRKPLEVLPGSEGVDGTSCVLDAEGHCITCSDEALPVKVLSVDQALGLALVESTTGAQEEVDVTLVDEVGPGDWLLVHGGAAIGNLESPTLEGSRHE